MKTKTRHAALKPLTALILLLVASATAYGGLTVVESKTDKGTLTTYKLTVTPAPEPVPALKHRLMLRDIELKPGNAAPFYYRAFLELDRDEKAAEEKFGDDLYKWYTPEVPLDKLPLEKVREAVELWTGSCMMWNLRTATGRRKCDWQWNTEELRGLELVSFYLDEIQDSRGIMRGLILRARLAMAEGRLDDALDCLRLNYRMAQDVAEEPFLVCDLIGIAIAGTGNCALTEFIAQPNSPNLYWALTELPRPLIGMRESIRSEMAFTLRTFPLLLDAETASHSSEEWARLWAEAFNRWQSYVVLYGDGGFPIPKDAPVLARAVTTGLSTMAYPGAKERLVKAGMDRATVERMAVGQVLAIDTAREYQRIADDYEKWYYSPYQAVRDQEPFDSFENTRPERPEPASLVKGGYGYVLAAMLLPTIRAVRFAEERTPWHMDGIRAVEAIRMHAAQTGHLPKSLDEIKVVPVPENPVTRKPFEYRLEGKTGILDLPFSDGFPGYALRFEITLAESSK